ncbi:MAG: AMIN domain-containing protein [Elusimicrobiales bacterium]|nr:AMIN domain-containing protein [Elusimicrobiales bacterium]
MKKFIATALTGLLLGQNPLVLFAVENATVKSVRVSAESVYIDTDKPVQYKAFTTENPSRLVLELMDSKLKTLQEIPVNGRSLTKVRTGQFKDTPVSISRVVMDLTQKTVYEISRKGTELVVMFGARSQNPARPSIKDSPAAVPAGVKVIAPETVSEKPLELTLEAAKPADLLREKAPVISPKKTYAAPTSRNIMDNLSRDPITFDYSEAEVREVIDMMAAKANLNVIYSDDVTGTVTISLSKVPFEEAFKTLLNVKGLAAQQVGDNIIRIATPSTFISEQKKGLQQTRVFFLNYFKAAEMKTQIDAVAMAEGRSSKSTPDENNNALIVTDTSLGLDATARLIRSLDRVPKQVMIEVKLVEVALDNSFDLGVNWNFKNAMGTTVGETNLPGPTPGGSTFGGALTFFGKINDFTFNTVIAAAVKKGKLKVLSDPKVATLNNKEATIDITDQVPYTTTDSAVGSGGATVTTQKVTYVPSGITLKVTPTINSDGRIAMHLAPQVSQASGGSATTPPNTNTRSTDTSVIVKDGETVVIGGLIRDSQSDDVYKVPILGDIPLLGLLFRKKSVARKRLELLIFVTPRIIAD